MNQQWNTLFWKTKQGREIHVSRLSDEHLANIFKTLNKKWGAGKFIRRCSLPFHDKDRLLRGLLKEANLRGINPYSLLPLSLASHENAPKRQSVTENQPRGMLEKFQSALHIVSDLDVTPDQHVDQSLAIMYLYDVEDYLEELLLLLKEQRSADQREQTHQAILPIRCIQVRYDDHCRKVLDKLKDL